MSPCIQILPNNGVITNRKHRGRPQHPCRTLRSYEPSRHLANLRTLLATWYRHRSHAWRDVQQPRRQISAPRYPSVSSVPVSYALHGCCCLFCSWLHAGFFPVGGGSEFLRHWHSVAWLTHETIKYFFRLIHQRRPRDQNNPRRQSPTDRYP